MNIIKRIWAFLTVGKLVWLKDHDDQVTLSISRIDPFGRRYAKRWWPTDFKNVTLLDGGKIKEDCYVKEWKYVREKDEKDRKKIPFPRLCDLEIRISHPMLEEADSYDLFSVMRRMNEIRRIFLKNGYEYTEESKPETSVTICKLSKCEGVSK